MTTATMDLPVENAQAATILQRAVCLTLFCHYLGNHRKVRTRKVAEAAGAPEPVAGEAARFDEEQVNATKKLVDSSELTAAMRVLDKAKVLLRHNAIPAHRVFGERTYLVGHGAVTAVQQGLLVLVPELRAEALALADRYEAAAARQAVKLGPLFDARDYPSRAQVLAAWGLEWYWVSFKAPENLETVDSATFAYAQEQSAARFADAFAEVRLVLCETLQQATSGLVEKLRPGDDGKPRVFKSTVLRDLLEFLATYDVRNIAGHTELDAVVARLRGLTAGLDPDALVGDVGGLRARTRAAVEAATADLAGLVATSRRAVRFGSLDDE